MKNKKNRNSFIISYIRLILAVYEVMTKKILLFTSKILQQWFSEGLVIFPVCHDNVTASWGWLIMLTSIYKNFNNEKLNFCSAGMSQEAFLPHINGAARHFWKKETTSGQRRSQSWKHVVISGQSADRKVTKQARSLGNLSTHS